MLPSFVRTAMPALQPGASIYRGLTFDGPDLSDEARERISRGEAVADDLLPLIDSDNVGSWWAHPDYGGQGLAENSSWVEPNKHISHPDGYGRGFGVVLEAEGPQGWDPETQFQYTAPSRSGGHPSVVPENIDMNLKKIHYQSVDPSDGEMLYHSVDVPEGNRVHVGPSNDSWGNYEQIKQGAIPAPTETSDIGTSGEQKDNGMVALIPTQEFLNKLYVDGGEPKGQIHLTLKFLPGAGDWDDEKRQTLLDSCEDLVARIRNGGPVTGKVFAHADFNPEEKQCATYLVSGIDYIIQEWRDVDLELELDLEPDKYGAWIPHITAGYDMDPDELEFTGEIEFDTLRCVIGGDQYDFPLGGE